MKEPLHRYKRLIPEKVSNTITHLIDGTFLAFNSARLREACHVFVKKYAHDNITIGISVSGALIPAGLGGSCLVPLMNAGFIDWMVMTGANIYHDLHFALWQELYIGYPTIDDCELRRSGIVRIYDIFFKNEVLFESDAYVRDFCRSLGRREQIGSAEFHYLLGEHLLETHEQYIDYSVLMTAAKLEIPIFTSSPGDSTLGMNLAAVTLEGTPKDFAVVLDINQTAGVVYDAKKNGGYSGLLILGGGSPKNFMLQTEPYIQEILGLKNTGHDYFIQFTDARPDTGGLSGATPSEAVSWGKVNPEKLPDTVVCYGDSTVYFPLFAAYVLESAGKRPLKRLYGRLDSLVEELRSDLNK